MLVGVSGEARFEKLSNIPGQTENCYEGAIAIANNFIKNYPKFSDRFDKLLRFFSADPKAYAP
jgi:hypothetical protein